MSDESIPPVTPFTTSTSTGPLALIPPPGAVHELAERAVDFVRHAVIGKKGGMILDYRPETLPILDHYLRQVPADQEETIALIASAAGAYFGEVIRRSLGGEWRQSEAPPETWPLVAGGGIRIEPRQLAEEAIRLGDDGSPAFEVPAMDREAVEEALGDKEVVEEEYYSLAGRLEVLALIADVLAARRLAEQTATPEPPEPEDD